VSQWSGPLLVPPADREGDALTWRSRFEGGVWRFERWARRHPVIFGLLLAGGIAIGLTIRWSRYNSENMGNLMMVLVIIFAVMAPVGIWWSWRIRQRMKRQKEAASESASDQAAD
jgi:putative copper export protein